MFEGFQAGADRQSRRRFAASGGISLALYAIIAIGIIAIASRPREKKPPPPIKVTFKKPARAKVAPKPPPAPRPQPRKRTAARKPSAGPAAAPRSMPEGGLAVGDASDFRAGGVSAIDWGAEVGGGLGGSGSRGVAAPPPPPPPPKLKSAGVDLPAGAIPPVPDSDNQRPAYPEAMRKKGVEGLVVLRVLVGTDGRVVDIDVQSGDEPFTSAAIEVVRSWRYKPALVEGRPKAVHRIIRVPFRLRA
jgi:protein TonB